MHEQLPLDFSMSSTMRMRKARKAMDKIAAEQPKLFSPAPPNIDVHLHSPLEAIAEISGSEPDRAIVWLNALVGSVRIIKAKRVAFPAEMLDRLLHIRAPAHVTLDAATMAVARGLWAAKLGLRPLTVRRHSQRLLASSNRWPTALKVSDAPWPAIATLTKLGIPLTVEPKARQLMTNRLGAAGAFIASAGLAGSAVTLEASSVSLLESLALPGLSYAGEPQTGLYKMPLLLADRLLKEPAIRVSEDLAAAIKKATTRVRPMTTDPSFPWTLYPFQARDAAQGLRILETTGGVLLAGDMGSGKLLDDNSYVMGHSGRVRVGDVKVGDLLIGSNGLPTEVLGVYPQGIKDIYEITFTDGYKAYAGDEHLWAVHSALQKSRALKKGSKPINKVMSTEEIRKGGLTDAAGNLKWYIPLCDPVQFASRPAEDAPISGYVLGALLADGGMLSRRLTFTTPDHDIRDRVEKESGATLVSQPRTAASKAEVTKGCDYTVESIADCSYRFRGATTLADALEKLDLIGKRSWERSVPEAYLYGSIETRRAVLQGLLDAGGDFVAVNGKSTSSIEFTSTSEQLADDLIFLVQSLGGTARKGTSVRKTYSHEGEKRMAPRDEWRVSLQLPDHVVPFYCARKAKVYVTRVEDQPSRGIKSIELIRQASATCFEVDAEDKLFLLEHFLVNHNTTISLALADTLRCWPLLVVAPLSAFSTWERQLGEMGKKTYLATEAPSKCWDAIEAGGWDVVVISYDRLHSFLEVIERYNFQAVIADELQRIRTPGSRRSRALRQLALSIPIRIGLSGTPLTNKIDDLLPLGSFLAPSEWRPRASSKDLDDMYPGDPVESIADHLGALMVRRRMEDTGAKLPQRKDHRVVIQLTPEQRGALAALEAEAEVAKEEGAFDDPGSKMHAFVRLQRMRQIINSPSAAGVAGPNPKVNAAIDLAEDFLAEGRKGVIFCADRQTFRDLGQALTDAGIGWVGIWGATPPMDRITNEKMFHSNAIAPNGYPTSVVLCTIQAGAESWSASPTATWLISTAYVYAPSTLSQMEARVYRMNSDINGPDIEICYIHANAPGGSLDDRMVEILEIKKNLFAQVVDRRAHVDTTQVHYSMADLVFLLTGKHDDKLAKAEADAKAAVAREQAMKRHAKVTIFKNKGANKRSSDYHDDGSMAKTLEEMLSEADLDEDNLVGGLAPDDSSDLGEETDLDESENDDFDVEEGDDEE